MKLSDLLQGMPGAQTRARDLEAENERLKAVLAEVRERAQRAVIQTEQTKNQRGHHAILHGGAGLFGEVVIGILDKAGV